MLKPNGSKKLNIVLIVLLCATVVLGTVAVFLFISRNNKKANTFDFNCAEYTDKMNRLIGGDKFDENEWKENKNTETVRLDQNKWKEHKEKNGYTYSDKEFTIDLDTDKDNSKVYRISVSPAKNKTASKIAAASIMVADKGVSQKEALDDLIDLKEGDKVKVVHDDTSTTYNEESDTFVIKMTGFHEDITPVDDDDKDHSKATKDEAKISMTEKPTEQHTKKPTEKPTEAKTEPETREYTAVELAGKSLSEIKEIMGGEYETEFVQLPYVFSSSGSNYFHNYDVLPGFAFHESGNGCNGISIMNGAKLNDSISSDMTYNQLAAVLGDFDVYAAGQGTVFYTTTVDGYDVSFCFFTNDNLVTNMVNGNISSDVLKADNPVLHSIGLRKDIN